MTAAELSKVLAGYRLPVTVENDLQGALELILENEHVVYRREVSRGRDRIDFVVERVGIECKVHCPVKALTNQLARYAQWEDLDELLVVSSDGKHTQAPSRLNGKPVFVHIVRGVL